MACPLLECRRDAHLFWGRDAILIALTGWGQEEDRRRAFEAGFNHHLAKPIAPEVLESVLQSVAAAPAAKTG